MCSPNSKVNEPIFNGLGSNIEPDFEVIHIKSKFRVSATEAFWKTTFTEVPSSKNLSKTSGFRTETSGFRTETSAFPTETLGFRTETSGFRTETSGFRTETSGFPTDNRVFENQSC
jgi:hypothetical protein